MRAWPALLLVVTGCFPMLTHGARVDPGMHAGFSYSLQILSPTETSEPSSPSLKHGMDFGFYGAAAGRPRGWSKGGFRFTGSLNLASGAVGDFYTEFPHALPGSASSGVGLLYQTIRGLVFAYAMNGWDLGDHSQLFVGLGAASTTGLDDQQQQHRSVLYTGMIGWQPPRIGRAFREAPDAAMYLMFIGGPQGPDCRTSSWCMSGQSRAMAVISVGLPPLGHRGGPRWPLTPR